MRVVGVVMKINLNKLKDYPKVMPYDPFLGAYHEQLPEWKAIIEALEEARDLINNAAAVIDGEYATYDNPHPAKKYDEWLKRF